MNSWIKNAQQAFAQDFSKSTLKALIIAVGIVLIGLGLFVDNTWVLAGILAYEVLP